MATVATAGLVLGLTASAQAKVLFTATETAPTAITQTAVIGNVFFLGYEETTVNGGCSVSNCLSATAGDGTPLGDFGFSVVSSPFNSITQEPGGGSALPSSGSYVEHYSGYGSFLISASGGATLLGGNGNYYGMTLWATPGSTSATMEFDINGDEALVGYDRATSDLLDVSGPLYLDVTGTTTSPVALTDLTPGETPDYLSFTDPLTVDFTVVLSDTPFSPSAGGTPTPGSTVPEPWTSSLMLSGLLALCLGRRMRNRAA